VICGVDEAGKGSVLGPMVVAAVGALSDDVLADLAIKDSKLLSVKNREHLFPLIQERCRIATVIIPPPLIDAWRKEITMNTCIARAHAAVIRRLCPLIAYVDACDVDPARYKRMVQENLYGTKCEIVSEHHADRTYRIVSAASIVAKVVRDQKVRELSQIYGGIGSGYPSDPVTIAFLSSYIKEHHQPPACARKSWRTVIALIADREQSTLDFGMSPMDLP
jgi:ribonuclease HII